MSGIPKHAPAITQLSWGNMEAEGLGQAKDMKLWPGGGRPWDWSETGTHHDPGILPADLQELMTHGARTVILSQGMLRRLGVAPDTLALARQAGVRIIRAETREAARLYNDLAAAGEAVGGLFHSTC